jgi:hypothetical protein
MEFEDNAELNDMRRGSIMKKVEIISTCIYGDRTDILDCEAYEVMRMKESGQIVLCVWYDRDDSYNCQYVNLPSLEPKCVRNALRYLGVDREYRDNSYTQMQQSYRDYDKVVDDIKKRNATTV